MTDDVKLAPYTCSSMDNFESLKEALEALNTETNPNSCS